MPSMTTISLVNGAETLVLSPNSVEPTHLVFQNEAAASIAKRELLHFDRPKDEKKEIRRSMRTNLPLVRTTLDGSEVLKMETGKTEFIFPADATATERARLVALHVKGLQNAFAVSILQDVVWAW